MATRSSKDKRTKTVKNDKSTSVAGTSGSMAAEAGGSGGSILGDEGAARTKLIPPKKNKVEDQTSLLLKEILENQKTLGARVEMMWNDFTADPT